MSQESDLARVVGNLEGRMKAIEKTVDDIDTEVKHIRSTLDSAGGSWRTLVALGAFVAAVAATVGSVATWLSMAPR